MKPRRRRSLLLPPTSTMQHPCRLHVIRLTAGPEADACRNSKHEVLEASACSPDHVLHVLNLLNEPLFFALLASLLAAPFGWCSQSVRAAIGAEASKNPKTLTFLTF